LINLKGEEAEWEVEMKSVKADANRTINQFYRTLFSWIDTYASLGH